MTVTAPFDQTDIRGRLHYVAMETATAAMVTDQMSHIASQAGHRTRSGAKHLTVTSGSASSASRSKDATEAITAEVESIYDGEILTVVVLIRCGQRHYSEVDRVITVTGSEFNHDWGDEFRTVLDEQLG